MRKSFTYRLYTQKLYCRRCSRVTTHGVFAMEKFSTYGGMDSDIPLLCSCDDCSTFYVAFSHEFAFCRRDMINTEYAKVYGRNRIHPGDWLFFEDAKRPCVVKSFLQSVDREIVIYNYPGMPEEKFEGPKRVITDEEAPNGYRLLPAQSVNTLMGDRVYHVLRKEFGLAVGRVKDGDRDELAVQLRDGTVVFITLPLMAQNLDNELLTDIAENKLRTMCPDIAKNVTVEVGQGVVYLKGHVKNLSEKRRLQSCFIGLRKVRGCVNLTQIDCADVADEQIEKQIWNILDAPDLHVFDCSVKVDAGNVKISFGFGEDSCPENLENRIAEIQGVKALVLSKRPVSVRFTDVCKNACNSLSSNSVMKGGFFRTTFVRNKFLLEGHVKNFVQKTMAFFITMAVVRSPLVENRLRIEP